MIRAVVDGVLTVLLAVVVGIGIAFGVGYVGLTDTVWWHLGPWLGGLGLLGTWQQSVDSTVGVAWTVTATGVPLLVTGVVALFIALRAHRSTWMGAPLAALAAAGESALLVLATRASDTVTNAAGSVTTVEGLSWWTPAGAAGVVAVLWLLHTVGRTWWQTGRGVAVGLLVWLGVLLTGAVAAGLIYVTSSTAVGIAAALLYPLAGTLALFAAAGAPGEAALPRLSPETADVSTWSQSLVYGVGGTVAAIVLAALVGLVLRLLKHRSTWLGALTVTPLLAACLAWAMQSRVLVPDAFGASSQVIINPLYAAAVGFGLAVVTRFCAGAPRRPGTPASAPASASDDSIEALLAQVGQNPSA